MKEIDNNYVLYSNGNVYNKSKKKFCKKYLNNRGYEMVSLKKNGIYKTYFVHRLLVEYFISPIDKNLEVNHINGIKTDNRIENLEIVTRSENMSLFYNDNRITNIKHLIS